MRGARGRRALLLGAILGAWGLTHLAPSGSAAGAQPAGTSAVTTAAYNNLRDGWDSDEPALSPSAIQSGSFGELFSRKLEGAIYAQPLVFGGSVIVTTQRAFAYAINASTGAIEWKRSFGTPFKSSTIGCSDLAPYIGSTSTPVIEPSTGTIYLTTRLQTGKGLSNSHWYLQALSAATGEEKPGFPVQIAGTPANTPGVPFNEHFSEQRPGLLLLNGVVYMAFASDCDITPYRGIVAGVNATSGKLTTMWSDESGVGTDESSQAGIWQSGGGLVSDIPGRVILTSGNGVSPSPAPSGKPPATLSESVVGLTVGSGGELTPTQFFAPSNAPTLDQNDEDLGSGGPIALPTEYFGTKAIPHLVVQVGKDGRIFLVNADNMGGYRQGPKEGDAVLQTVGPFDGVWGHPAAYGGQGGWVYVLESAGGGFLRALSYGLNGKGEPALSSVATSAESFGYTSGSPLVTSDGTAAGSAVVWVEYSSGPGGGHAQLRAYGASPSGETLPLLYSHAIGAASKFAVPTAAEGRVYVGTRNGSLIAFGQKGAAAVQAAPVELGSVPVGESQSSTVDVSASREVTVTGPVEASGEQGDSSALEAEEEAQQAEAERTGAAAGASAKAAAAHAEGLPKHPDTAGPKRVPPSGNTPLADGVITVQQPPVGSAIAAGASLRLHVSFRPRRAGPVVGQLLIHTSAGTVAVTLSGYGTARGLALSAPPLDFRTIDTRAGGKALSVTFANSWSAPETLTGFQLPRGPYAVSGLPAVGTVLAPRHAVTVSVLFDPRRPGRYPARLRIYVDGRPTTLAVSGTAVAGFARLTVSTHAIDAGAVPVGHARTLAFTLTDSGTVPLTISRAIAPEGAFFAPVPLPEGITLEPHTHLDLKVTFRPRGVGPLTGEYRFNSNAGGGYTVVRFSGRGVRGR
jgi:outer membrane protein assembly factor BamB